MTGFGRGKCVSGGTNYTVEVSTVNRRHAELIFNLPRELASLEPMLRSLVAPAVTRGRATVTAAVSAGRKARPLLDADLLGRLHAELKVLQKKLGLRGAIAWPDLIALYATTARESGAAAEPDTRALAKAATEALRSLDATRKKEGAHLGAELRQRLAIFAAHIGAIRLLAPQVAAKHRASLSARLDAINPAFAADDERFARELALYADRADITEELSRLESHLAQFRSSLSSKEAQGRALDFLAQEMFRECNTIGAKANSAEVAREIIAAKTELERIREQVQNVE